MNRPPEASPAAAGPDAEESLLVRPPGWSRRLQDVAVVLWSSFLVGGVATMCFFAVFDPLLLAEGTALAPLAPSHNAGYAIGFFCFWLIGAVAGGLAVYLVRTQRGAGGRRRDWPRGEP
jgi:hypothetical protein